MRGLVSCYSEHTVKISDSSCSGSSSGGSGGGGGGSSSNKEPSVQSAVTCLYRSRLISTQKELLIRVTWSKSLVGLGLSIGVDNQPCDNNNNNNNNNSQLLLKKKKGSRSFRSSGDSEIKLYWDISSARYNNSGPEPVEGFYVLVVADSEYCLLLGDLSRERVKSTGGESLPVAESSLVCRREQVLGGCNNTFYSTKARFCSDGRDHEIMISCKGDERDAKDSELLICIDKKRVVEVRRLRWNFRGNQTIFVDGLPVDMMWDVHGWWFSGGSALGSAAVFMFRTRSGMESRLWLEEDLLQKEQAKSAFSLLIHAFKNP